MAVPILRQLKGLADTIRDARAVANREAVNRGEAAMGDDARVN